VTDADHVSWFLIRWGWKVLSADGERVGRVVRVRADRTRDIFNGITFRPGLFRRARYVPAEQIAEIRRGSVRLKLEAADVERLQR
jgi:hypothetical protein